MQKTWTTLKLLRSLLGLRWPTWPTSSWEESMSWAHNCAHCSQVDRLGFRPLCCNPCLHAAFKNLNKDNKPLYDLTFSSLNSLAAAHAESHAAAFIPEFVRNLSSVLHDSPWVSFCVEAEWAVFTDVLPLCDVSWPCWRRWSLDCVLALLSMQTWWFSQCFSLRRPLLVSSSATLLLK